MPDSVSSDNSFYLAEVFRDASAHRMVSGIINNQLVNNKDIREEALKGLDLYGFTNIIDLGCAFGYFTEALAG